MMQELLDGIARADSEELNELLQAVIKRYAELFPDWDISTISIRKCGDRNEQLDGMIRLLEKMKSI